MIKAASASILTALAAIMLALLLGACAAEQRWGVVLLVPVHADIALEVEPAYQITHIGVGYDSEAACRAVWADRCAPKLKGQ